MPPDTIPTPDSQTMPPPAETPLVFIDLETTGANFARDRVLEVGLIELTADGEREWSTLVNPGVAVSAFITGLTGIDDAMVAAAPPFAAIADDLLVRLRGKCFVAHNARFDYGFLKAEFARLGIDFRATVLCTVKLSRKLFPGFPRHNLDSLIERHGIVVGDRHRALADARVLRDLWQGWRETPGETALHAAVAALTRPVILPERLDPALADELPECHGAWALRDADGAVLATGRATNLRHKVLALFADGRASRPPAALAQQVDWTATAGEFGARLAEIRYQGELAAAKSGPARGEYWSWQLRVGSGGDFRPTLVDEHSAQFGLDDDLYGLYETAKEARQALRKLAEAHFLCPALLGLETPKSGDRGCSAARGGHCRGACCGREPLARHGARLFAALARLKLRVWPHAGPVALVERDEFGMREDFHLFDRWRYYGRAEAPEVLEDGEMLAKEVRFDSDIYRAYLKYSQGSALRLIALPAALRPPAR